MAKQSLGSRIKELRESREMTQAELAGLLFVSDKTISKWEKDNSTPDTDLLIKISEIFKVTLDYLITGKNKETVDDTISRIELACREDNIALLDGVDIEAFDSKGKNVDYYAKKYKAKRVSNYLLNYMIDKHVEKNRISRKYHICALPKDSDNEDDLTLIAWNGPYSKAASTCAEFEKKGWHSFRVFREIGVNEDIKQDYQYFFFHCLDGEGENKVQVSIAILDDDESGIINLNIYENKEKLSAGDALNAELENKDLDIHRYAYVRPAIMKEFLELLSSLNVAGWENRSWGCPVHDLFFVLKNPPKGDDLACHKYYVAPKQDDYKKFIKGIQRLCVESLKGRDYRKFTSFFDSSYDPYRRACLTTAKANLIFKDIENEQKEMREGHFDLTRAFKEEEDDND